MKAVAITLCETKQVKPHLKMLWPDLEKMNSMNSAEFNFLKDFPQNLSFFLQNLAP